MVTVGLMNRRVQMDYYERIQRSIDFIERNLTEEFTLQQVAEQAYFSLYHFHRVFQGLVDLSVKEYIRRRRLTCAAEELVETRNRVLDIALKYQYETAESFTRAFKKMFHVTPGQYRKAPWCVAPYSKINLLELRTQLRRGGMAVEPRFVTREEFQVVGVVIQTTTDQNQNLQAIPAFWEEQMAAGVVGKLANLPGVVNPNANMGICFSDDMTSEEFYYMIGVEVHELEQIPEGMECKVIPASKYAVFTAKGLMPNSVQQAWQYIYQTWFPESGYERGETPDFELYDERCTQDETCEVEIWIPIQ